LVSIEVLIGYDDAPKVSAALTKVTIRWPLRAAKTTTKKQQVKKTSLLPDNKVLL